eukprot:403337723
MFQINQHSQAPKDFREPTNMNNQVCLPQKKTLKNTLQNQNLSFYIDLRVQNEIVSDNRETRNDEIINLQSHGEKISSLISGQCSLKSQTKIEKDLEEILNLNNSDFNSTSEDGMFGCDTINDVHLNQPIKNIVITMNKQKSDTQNLVQKNEVDNNLNLLFYNFNQFQDPFPPQVSRIDGTSQMSGLDSLNEEVTYCLHSRQQIKSKKQIDDNLQQKTTKNIEGIFKYKQQKNGNGYQTLIPQSSDISSFDRQPSRHKNTRQIQRANLIQQQQVFHKKALSPKNCSPLHQKETLKLSLNQQSNYHKRLKSFVPSPKINFKFSDIIEADDSYAEQCSRL